jgi:hypothetical protein
MSVDGCLYVCICHKHFRGMHVRLPLFKISARLKSKSGTSRTAGFVLVIGGAHGTTKFRKFRSTAQRAFAITHENTNVH